jgi:hypothetical protein
MRIMRLLKPRLQVRLGLVACVAALLGLAIVPTTQALTTIGQVAPTSPSPPPVRCNALADIVQPTVQSGATYVVPAGGAMITSWSTTAAAGPGQMFEMKVFRQVNDPLTYKVVGHDGPRSLAPGALNTFVVNIPVQPGDLVGLNDVATAPDACTFDVLGELYLARPGSLNDGDTGGPFIQENDGRANISAVVAIQPSNAFSFTKVKLNKKKGIATLAVDVPGAGKLALSGKGVKAQRTGRVAVASRTVSAAGIVKLPIKAKGKAKKTLTKTGKAKVKVTVAYTPTGDLPGDPKTKTKRIKLVKQR